MESNIDKYSHKLSVKNNISYEIARHEIEKKVNKLEEKHKYDNNLVKSAYKILRNKMNGGSKNIYKINYTF
jgi:hypothetical protein